METIQCAADGEVETKVQVDRKRLEAMITGEAAGEDAAAFFARVERCTGARVCWPSRLKIRAKTKKDPFVKLIGAPQSVQKATEMIEAQLRVKKERVTLKIEVSHSLHSQIIGRGGKNTQKIMRDTNCHIHFPDSNKSTANSPTLAKNDQVSISGCAKDVERAREMIRAICPLTVSVTIQLGLGRNLYALQSRLDPAQLQSHFPPTEAGADLTVQFLHQGPPLLGTLHFLMRSSARNELDMLRAFGKVCQLIGVFPSGAELLCSSQFELRPAALPSTGSVRWIAFRTNTQIQLNDQGLLISGSLEGIFIARKLLTGLLPVSLQFENPSDQLITSCPSLYTSLESELDVQIGERKRRKGSNKPGTTTGAEERDFAIGTYEANLFGAYTARNRLLKIKEDPEKDQFPRDSESAAFMRSMCRESLMADQQAPLVAAAASVAFANSGARSFGQSSDARNWRTEAKKPIGVDVAKCVEKAEGPKSPDPQESPIAAGLLAGAKSVNSQKGEFRKVLDRERMLLKANRAIYNSPMLDFGQEEDKHRTPTDLWAGYGFSSSLPVDLLRLGRTGGEAPERRGRPIVGMGTDGKAEKEERKKGAEEMEKEDGEEGSWRRKKKQENEDEEGSWRRDNTTHKEPFFGQSIIGPSPAISQSSTLFTRSNSSKLNPSSSILRNSIQLVVLREEEEEEPNRSEKADQKETEGARSARMGQRLDTPSPAKVHPRVAALQMTEQRKPKFTMSTGLFDTFRSSAGGGAGGALAPSAADQNSKECAGAMAAVGSAAPIWDIRVLSEPALVLAQLGLAEHVPFFREQEIDMQAFLLLDEQCLRTLGVTTLGARRKIMHAIMKLRDSAQRHGMYSL